MNSVEARHVELEPSGLNPRRGGGLRCDGARRAGSRAVAGTVRKVDRDRYALPRPLPPLASR